jgi:hypothetical protein
MPKKPKSKSYVQIGSTIINVPPKMVGFDAQHHKHLYNTTTPNHNIAIHNGKPAIKFVRNVKTTRKINKVPFSTKYTTLDEPKKPRQPIQPRQPRQQAQQVIIGLPAPAPPPPMRPAAPVSAQQRIVAPAIVPQPRVIRQPPQPRPATVPVVAQQRIVAPVVIPQPQQVAIVRPPAQPRPVAAPVVIPQPQQQQVVVRPPPPQPRPIAAPVVAQQRIVAPVVIPQPQQQQVVVRPPPPQPRPDTQIARAMAFRQALDIAQIQGQQQLQMQNLSQGQQLVRQFRQQDLDAREAARAAAREAARAAQINRALTFSQNLINAQAQSEAQLQMQAVRQTLQLSRQLKQQDLEQRQLKASSIINRAIKLNLAKKQTQERFIDKNLTASIEPLSLSQPSVFGVSFEEQRQSKKQEEKNINDMINASINNSAALNIQKVFRGAIGRKKYKEEKQVEKATNAFFKLEAVFQRKLLQRKLKQKIEQKKQKIEQKKQILELRKSFKIFSKFIKRKEAQRNYENIRQQSLHDKLAMIYKNVGSLLQTIQQEYKTIYDGKIPNDVINRRRELDKKLNDELDFAKDILNILDTKFGENIKAHIYNIDRFKKEIVDREKLLQKQIEQELVKSLNIKDLNDTEKLNVLKLASEQPFVNPLLQKQELVKSLNIKDLNDTEKLNVLKLASEQPFVNPIPNPIPIQSLFRRNKAKQEVKELKAKQEKEKEELRLEQEKKQQELDLKLATSSDIIKRTIEKKALKEKGKKQIQELKAKQEKEKEKLKLKQEEEKKKEEKKQQKAQKELDKLNEFLKIIERLDKYSKYPGFDFDKLDKYFEAIQNDKFKKYLDNMTDEQSDIYDRAFTEWDNFLIARRKLEDEEEEKRKEEQKQKELEMKLATSSDIIKRTIEKKALKEKGKKQIQELKTKQEKEKEELRLQQEQKQKELEMKLATSSDIIKRTIEKKALKEKGKKQIQELKTKQEKEKEELRLQQEKEKQKQKEIEDKQKGKLNELDNKYMYSINDLKTLKEQEKKLVKELEQLKQPSPPSSTIGSLFGGKSKKQYEQEAGEYKKQFDKLNNKLSDNRYDQGQIQTFISKYEKKQEFLQISERQIKDYIAELTTYLNKPENTQSEILYKLSNLADFYKKLDYSNFSQMTKEEYDIIYQKYDKRLVLQKRAKLIMDRLLDEADKIDEELTKEEKSKVKERAKEEESQSKQEKIKAKQEANRQKQLAETQKRKEEQRLAKEEQRLAKEEANRQKQLVENEKRKEEQRLAKEEERLAKEKAKEEERLAKEEQDKAKKWAKYDKLKEEVLPLILKLKDLYEKRQTMDISEFSKFRKMNKDMYDAFKSVLQFKNKYDEREWKKIAYEDLSDWNELINQVRSITSRDYATINKEFMDREIEKMRIEQKKEEKAEKIRLEQLAKLQEENRKRMEEDEKRKQIAQELKARERENAEIVAKALEQAKNEDQKNVARFKTFIEKMTLIENSFLKDPNNLQTLESNIKKFQVIINDYYTFKSSLDKDELRRALIEWGISNDDLKTFEKQMATKNGEWEKLIADKKAAKQKEQDEKEKRVKIRQKEIQSFVDKIKKIDEEISPLYLTEYASDKDSMTSSQREKLYNKILKLYNTYSDTKRLMSEYEYKYVLEANPEWEIFKRIKQEYLGNEREAIKQLKEEEKKPKKEYTKEEVDSWSFSKVKSFLREKGFLTSEALIGPKKGVDPDDVRFAYNAYQRFARKGEK